jgi:hypothetical protein
VKSDLQIEIVQFALSSEILAVMRSELEAGGISSGNIFIGGIAPDEDSFYILWSERYETTVSIMAKRDEISDPGRARAFAQAFVLKWKQR